MYEKVFHVLTTKTKALTIYAFYLLIVKEQLEWWAWGWWLFFRIRS